MHFYHTYLRSVLILFSPTPRFLRSLFSTYFHTKQFKHFSDSTYMPHIPQISSSLILSTNDYCKRSANQEAPHHSVFSITLLPRPSQSQTSHSAHCSRPRNLTHSGGHYHNISGSHRFSQNKDATSKFYVQGR